MSEKEDKAAAKKRNAGVAKLTHEAMRDKISFTKTLQAIDEAEMHLRGLAVQESEPSTARIGAYNALLNSKWNKMKKLLPDLKSIEHSGQGLYTVKVVDLTGNAPDDDES